MWARLTGASTPKPIDPPSAAANDSNASAAASPPNNLELLKTAVGILSESIATLKVGAQQLHDTTRELKATQEERKANRDILDQKISESDESDDMFQELLQRSNLLNKQ